MSNQMDFKYRQVQLPSIKLHIVEAGPSDGPLIILLHGFPDFWQGFESQILAFAQAGFHVVAPDQRGYNLSEKPSLVSDYGARKLAEDVVELINHFNAPKAFIGGHDWGGVVAWLVASIFPDKVIKLLVFNISHPAVMQRFLQTHTKQKFKSWYMLFFQIPWLPEAYLRAFNFFALRRTMQKNLTQAAFMKFDFNAYIKAWGQPGALRSAINWYRAALRFPIKPLPNQHIQIPTLLIWGEKDPFLSKEMAQESIDLCDQGELHRFAEAGHWVHLDEEKEVNKIALRFLTQKNQ